MSPKIGKTVCLLLTICLVGIAGPVWAKMLTGRVESLDPATRSFVMQVTDPDVAVVVKPAAGFVGPCRRDRIFPGCVRPGNMIRVWGEFAKSQANSKAGEQERGQRIFLATDIRGGGGGDPTGVRFRIGRGCRFRGRMDADPSAPLASKGETETAEPRP